MTIIDGECARVAKNILCKIFIILAYSQYRRYKYSSCTPPGCYEICCYLFSEGTLMRPPVIAEVSPPGNTYHPTPPASSTHEAQIYIMRTSYPGGVVAVITGGCGAYPRHRRASVSAPLEGVPELHTTAAWEAHIRTILDCKFIFITIRHYTHHHSA